MKKQLLLVTILSLSHTAFAQTTQVFKPGPMQGEHSTLMTTYGCILSGQSVSAENVNGHTAPDMHYADWSYTSIGCSRGTMRELLRFTGLSTIPSNAVIIDAKLYLYGVPSSLHAPNSTYPGSPFPTTNDGWLKRVTSNWSKNTVTWNSQPTTTAVNQVAIQPSATQWNWNTTLNVTNLVKDIKSSGQNNGFMFVLQTEESPRHVEFASSDHSDSTLWPALEVTYQLPQGVSGINVSEPLIIFPNPASTYTTLHLPTSMTATTTIRIADMTGRIVIEQQVMGNGKEIKLDVAALAKGLYIIKAENSRQIATAKLLLH